MYMFLMRDEKEERRKYVHVCIITCMDGSSIFTCYIHYIVLSLVEMKGTKMQTLGASAVAGAWHGWYPLYRL